MNLPSGLWGGLHFCILVYGVDLVDYIFAFWSLSLGWIRGGLHFCILVYGRIIHFENLLGKNKSQFHQLNYAIWVD